MGQRSERFMRGKTVLVTKRRSGEEKKRKKKSDSPGPLQDQVTLSYVQGVRKICGYGSTIARLMGEGESFLKFRKT